MRKRRYLLLFLAGGLLATCLVAALYREPEPSYQGRPLREWVRDLAVEGTPERVRAIDAMGTNAVPLLMKWVRYETPGWKAAYHRCANPLLRHFGKRPLNDNKEQQLAYGAAYALLRLQRDAPQVTAECKKLALDTNTSLIVRVRVLPFVSPTSAPHP